MSRSVTNLRGLPDLWVSAVSRETYSKGHADYSVTGLLDSPRRAQLRQRHPVVEDASDLMWSTYGQLMHLLIERAASKLDPREALMRVREVLASTHRNKLQRISAILAAAEADDTIIERRFFAEFDGVVVSGQVDMILDGPSSLVVDIGDWKNTKAETWCWGGRDEWEAQVNIYALLAGMHDYSVQNLYLFLLFRNWEEKNVGTMERGWVNGYPDRPVMQVTVPRWGEDRVRTFVGERIQAHVAARVLADNELPPCTEHETWKGRRCARHCKVAQHCDVGVVALAKAAARRNRVPADTAFVGSTTMG